MVIRLIYEESEYDEEEQKTLHEYVSMVRSDACSLLGAHRTLDIAADGAFYRPYPFNNLCRSDPTRECEP